MTPAQLNHLGQIFQLIAKNAKYPEDESEIQGDSLSDFDNHRRSIITIFKNVSRLAPPMALDFIKVLISNTVSNLGSLSFRDVEAAMLLFYEIAEPLPGIIS